MGIKLTCDGCGREIAIDESHLTVEAEGFESVTEDLVFHGAACLVGFYAERAGVANLLKQFEAMRAKGR